MPTLTYRSFSAGEVSPRLGARVDQVKYQTGAYRMRNLVPTLEGAAQNRSGSGFVRPCHDFTAPSPPRILPFVFSDDQSYVIVLEDLKLSIISLGEPQLATGVNISAVSLANPCVVTTTGAHGRTTGDLIWIDGVEGTTQLNKRFFRAVVLSGTTIELEEETGADVDATAYTAWTSGGTVAGVYRITAPWAGADLRQIRFAQSADVMFFSHSSYPVYKLERTAGPTWTLSAVVFEPAIDGPIDGALTGSAGAVTTRYQVTAVDADTLEESFPGYGNSKAFAGIQKGGGLPVEVTTTTNHLYATGERVIFADIVQAGFTFLNGVVYPITVTSATTFTLDGSTLGGGVVAAVAPAGDVQHNNVMTASLAAPSSGSPITVAWSAVAGALEYNIYREINGIFGYVGTSATASFQDLGYEVEPFDTPPIDRDVFAVTGDYPTCVAFFQQRLLAGGSINNIERIDAGRTALLYNFTKSNPIQENDSFSWVMRSEKVQAVRHILEMSRCMVFTQSAVFTLEGDQSGALLPGSVNPRKRAEHGLGDVAPIAIGNAVLYVQATGKVVNEILPGTGDDFNSKDLTVYSRHLFDNNTIIAWSYAKDPASIVWAARDDGSMLGFTYLREHDVWGWSRHDTGDGDQIVDMCTVPENGESITYLVVRRFGTGLGDRYYIERMASRQISHACDGKFLDSYRFEEDANEDVGNTYRLNYDTTYAADGSWWLEPTGGTSPFTEGDASPDLGRTILLYGPDGERLWCTINQINTQFQAFVSVRCDVAGCLDRDTGAPNGADIEPTDEEEDLVPFPITLPYTTSDWSQSVASITDAWHLEGREVYAVVDGFPQGPFTVTNGSFALSSPGVLVVWGLQILADLITLEADNPDGETWTDVTKTVGQVTVRVENTLGLQVGVSVRKLQAYNGEWKERERKHDEGALYTGRLTVPNLGHSTPTGRVYLRQASGLPTTILGVYPQVSIGEK
jgi:hypothetical protein